MKGESISHKSLPKNIRYIKVHENGAVSLSMKALANDSDFNKALDEANKLIKENFNEKTKKD